MLEISMSALATPDSGRGWLLALRDVSHRHRAQALEREHEERARRSQSMEALGRLAGGIAHDFNNLLTIVTSCAQLTKHRFRGVPDIVHEMDTIEEAALRGSELTQQLLAVGGRRPLARRVLSPAAVVERLSPMLERVLPENIEFDVDLRNRTARVLVDEASLEQAILNLVVNAKDAMPDGGRLSIRTHVVNLNPGDGSARGSALPGPYVEVTVRDSGSGMNEEIRARIFEPFFTTKGDAGTGLGLASAHGLVMQSGGHVEVDSQPGSGTCFRLLFPVTRVEPDDELEELLPESVA
jgi:signal transduction histidine kinase